MRFNLAKECTKYYLFLVFCRKFKCIRWNALGFACALRSLSRNGVFHYTAYIKWLFENASHFLRFVFLHIHSFMTLLHWWRLFLLIFLSVLVIIIAFSVFWFYEFLVIIKIELDMYNIFRDSSNRKWNYGDEFQTYFCICFIKLNEYNTHFW